MTDLLKPPKLDDQAALARMLADYDDLRATFAALREAHVMDAGGPLMESFSRFAVALDMDGIEIRHLRNLIVGAP